MQIRSLLLFFILAVSGSCVDQVVLLTDIDEYPVVVEGFISDQPGPYQVRVSRSFDVQSKTTTKTYISAKRIILSDNLGNEEVLRQDEVGYYSTDVNGMRGQIGRWYKIKVELLDGRIFESIADTLRAPGMMESVDFSFYETKNRDLSTSYGFNVFFDASSPKEHADFLWQLKGTYQIETNPELYAVRCGESFCPAPRGCSGYVSTGLGIERVSECTCCTCWVDFYNDIPILSDAKYVRNGNFNSIFAMKIPLNAWVFMHKVHIEIKQLSLSPQALRFWRSIKDQKEASNSLFQPISGIVPNNYIQLQGSPSKLEGFFFATAVMSKSTFITRQDVPNEALIPNVDVPFNDSCLGFPNSTTQKPSYWQ
jgi:hypothetical protein